MSRKKSILFLLLVFSLQPFVFQNINGGTSNDYYGIYNPVDDLIEAYSGSSAAESINETLKHYMNVLTKDIGVREMGTESNQVARDYIKEVLTNQIGGVSLIDIGTFGNVVGVMRGTHANMPNTGRPTLLLMANYDTRANSSGASDNAAGVAVMLFVAKMLRELNLRLSYDIYFCFTNGGSYGGLGATQIGNYLKYQWTQKVKLVVTARSLLHGVPVTYHELNGPTTYFANSLVSISKNYFNKTLKGAIERPPKPVFPPPPGDDEVLSLLGFPVLHLSASRALWLDPNWGSMEDNMDNPAYSFDNAIEYARALAVSVVDWSIANEYNDRYHFYFMDLEPNEFAWIAVEDKNDLVSFRFTCNQEGVGCEVKILRIGYGLEGMNLVYSPTYVGTFYTSENTSTFWEPYRSEERFIGIQANASIKLMVMLGADKDKDLVVDRLSTVLFDQFYSPFDLVIVEKRYTQKTTTSTFTIPPITTRVNTYRDTGFVSYSEPVQGIAPSFTFLFVVTGLFFSLALIRRRRLHEQEK